MVDYRGRKVYVLKTKTVIAHDKKSGESIEGYVYLCRDIQAQHSKIDHLMNSKKFPTMTNEEFLTACDKLGLFAIVTTRDLPPVEVLPEYYIRQKIEQFFDFAKNFGRFLPVRCQSMETLKGHMLLAFGVSFIICLIEYRLNLVDTRYLLVRESMQDAAVTLEDGTAMFIETDDGKMELTIEQDILMDIYCESAGELFSILEYQMADVYDDEIIPEPIIEVNSLYEAYGLHSPYYVELKEGRVIPVLREGDVDACTKVLAFARKPTMTDEEIKAKRAETKQKKLEKAAANQGFTLSTAKTDGQQPSTNTESTTPESTPEGTPKGTPESAPEDAPGDVPDAAASTEHPTAEDTAKAAKVENTDTSTSTTVVDGSKPKRKRGRPLGSKNKKTLERERLAAEDAASSVSTSTEKNSPSV